MGVGRHTRAGSPGRVPPVGESREPLDDRISPRRRLRHLAAAGFEALRSVLLLGLRARASGLDELLGAELALHRSLGDVHLVGLAIEAGRLGRQLGGLVVVGGLASLGLGEEVVHGDGAAHGPRLSTVWGSPARGFSLWGSRGVPPVPSRVARRRQTSRHFPRRAGWTNQQDHGTSHVGPLTQDLNRILHSETSDVSRVETKRALTVEFQARRSRDTRSGSPSRARYAGRG